MCSRLPCSLPTSFFHLVQRLICLQFLCVVLVCMSSRACCLAACVLLLVCFALVRFLLFAFSRCAVLCCPVVFRSRCFPCLPAPVRLYKQTKQTNNKRTTTTRSSSNTNNKRATSELHKQQASNNNKHQQEQAKQVESDWPFPIWESCPFFVCPKQRTTNKNDKDGCKATVVSEQQKTVSLPCTLVRTHACTCMHVHTPSLPPYVSSVSAVLNVRQHGRVEGVKAF